MCTNKDRRTLLKDATEVSEPDNKSYYGLALVNSNFMESVEVHEQSEAENLGINLTLSGWDPNLPW